MFIIDQCSIASLRDRLGEGDESGWCLEQVRKILEIKEALLWRADVGPCCAGPGLAPCLFEEVRLLEGTVRALEAGDFEGARWLFDDFASRLEFSDDA